MHRIIHSEIIKYLSDYQDVMQRGYMPRYHAVICDPPYYLGGKSQSSGGFMGKSWDGFDSPQAYQAWVTEWASLLLDYVYPGGVLMAFGGTRTYHRLVCGLEDAGWEIYDSIGHHTYYTWNYGSGFPKSHDISKAIDSAAGAEREVVGVIKKTPYSTENTNQGWQRPSPNFNAPSEIRNQMNITAPATPAAAQWSGYGSAIKPSFEPIVVARKPRNGYTYAECATQFGSSALNIDGCRIAVDDMRDYSVSYHRASIGYGGSKVEFESGGHDLGRWPANTMLTHHPACNGTCHPECHVRVLDKSADNPARFFYQAKAAKWERDAGLDRDPVTVGDGRKKSIDNAYQRGETPRRNPHPTVKPIQLITELATLCKPPIEDSRILIPFSGSGSEMIGAHLAGWSHITGIEMTDEYIPIARARLQWWQRFNSYAMAEAHYKNHDDSQMTLFEALA